LPRTRTTKKLAQRIDLDYLKRPSTLRRWSLLLSVGVPAVALLWIAWFGLRRDRRVYSAGPLSSAHAVLTKQCFVCHTMKAVIGDFGVGPETRKCLACHDAPTHHGPNAYTPGCSECHAEHRGAIRLSATSDADCARCHADLLRYGNSTSSTNFTRTITSFGSNHPEFAVVRSGRADPGTIQLNHYRHLQPNLLGPNGSRVQMVCSDCHRSAADAAGQWFYGDAKSQAGGGAKGLGSNENSSTAALPVGASRAYMAPATYAQTCAGCHTLQFDKRIADAAPHDKPEVVHAFVVAKLQAYIADHPFELRVPRDPGRDLPEKPIPADYRLLTPPQWVGERAAEDEALLWRKTCKQCHTVLAGAGDALPKIAPSNITARYMPHANFDHSQHGLLDCAACHAAALTSQQSSDVLLPGIATCRACHHAGAEAAESRCFECHTYHDPSQQKPAHGNFSLAELR
jgi:hypothetical protein